MSEHNLELRVGVMESKLDGVVAAVRDLAHSVKEIASRPSNIAWREVAMTAGAFLALFAYVDRYVQSKVESANAVDRYRIEQLEQSVRLIAPVASSFVIGKRIVTPPASQ